jgi:iron(III) transport system substrate-binding protein
MNFFHLPHRLAAAAAAVAAFASLSCLAQDASLLQYTGADRNEKLVAAAKKEGSFTFYTSIAEKDIPPLTSAFEQKYGIKVRVWRAGTDKVLQRTLMEANGKRNEVDAVHISAPEMEALYREKIFQPVKSPYFKDLIASAKPQHQEWVSTLLTVWVQAYNTNKVKKEDLPKSYQDLLDPKWKGKLGIEAEDADWFAAVVSGMGEAKGLQLFRDIVAANGMSVRKGHSLLTNMVAAGEVPLGLTVYNYMPEAVKKKGAPIDWFAIEPAIGRANGIGIARNAQHPNAAALFYDFILSPEGQHILTSMSYVPVNTTVESPLKKLKVAAVDPVLSLDNMQKWSKLYDEIVLRKGGK